MCHSIKYRYWDRRGLHGELGALSAAVLFCTAPSLAKGGCRARRGSELPCNSAAATFPPGFPSAALLHSSFPEQSPKSLFSSTFGHVAAAFG